MNAEPSQPISESAPAADTVADAADSSLPVTAIPARGAPWLPLWLLTLGAGLVSGLISWGGGEAIYPAFHVQDEEIYPANYKTIKGYQKEGVDSKIRRVAQRIVERKKAVASFGLLGLVLAVGLGGVGGLAAASSRKTLIGIVVGALAGAGAGGGISLAAIPLFFRFQDPDSGLLVLFLTHAAIFEGVGAAAGLALGLGLGGRPAIVRALFGGLLGAFVGTIALEVINSLAFPLMRTFEPIPSEPIPRLVEYVCVAVCTGLVVGLAAGKPTTKPVPLSTESRAPIPVDPRCG